MRVICIKEIKGEFRNFTKFKTYTVRDYDYIYNIGITNDDNGNPSIIGIGYPSYEFEDIQIYRQNQIDKI